MKITTEFLGEIELEPKDIITFPKGILAFDQYKKFTLLDLPDSPLIKLLQSTEEKQLNFLVTNPFHFFPDYDFKLGQQEQKLLEVKKPEDLATFVILTLNNNQIEHTTANLLGPVVINSTNKQGVQFVLQDTNYSTKAPLLSSPDRNKKEACK